MSNTTDKRLLIVWPQYRTHNRSFFESILEIPEVLLEVIWVRPHRADDLPGLNFLAQCASHVVGAKDIRVGDYTLATLQRLVRLLVPAVLRCDAVLSSTQAPLHSKVAFFTARLLRRKIFLVLQQWEDLPGRGVWGRLYGKIGYAMLRRADRVFVHGQNQAQFALSRGCKAERIAVLPFLSDDLAEGSIPAIEAKKRLGLEGRKVVLYFSRVTPQKGLDLLISAFRIISEQLPGTTLLVCGGADQHFADYGEAYSYAAHCKTQAAGLNVQFMGEVAPADKAIYFSAADVFVHPHANTPLTNEGWGLVINEAASMGIPIVATRKVAAAADLVRHGESGFVLTPGSITELTEKVSWLLCNDEERSQFGQKSREVFESYHRPENIAARLQEAMLG
ncbi:glycosyltransferase family 4 protein [Desulfobulbus sp.]|uniref:glycosyltransferase family 4 protein n=1 Tax=Desulfobulbus sp. TaxID=895 RepID=UPI0027B8E929|nr:glycosyltransferase family 4 protein [Desulfobulbus sp.]